MKIEVTRFNIENGIRCVGDSCPIALAIKREGFPDVMVEDDYVMLSPSFELAGLPDEAQDFIENYDAGNPVEPITFDIVVEPLHEQS